MSELWIGDYIKIPNSQIGFLPSQFTIISRITKHLLIIFIRKQAEKLNRALDKG